MTCNTKKPLITALGAYKPNNNPSLEYMYFLEPHIFVTEIIYYLNEEPLMLFTSVDSLGVDSFSILLIMAVGREKFWLRKYFSTNLRNCLITFSISL